MVTPAARREAVARLRSAFEVSERRACAALGVDRTSVRYHRDRPDDAAVRARMRELAAIRRWFGYRRLLILMRREGLTMNHKKFRRLYREERLQVRRRGGRKRALGTRAPLAIPQGPNQCWSLDFVSDAFAEGRRFRILAVVDEVLADLILMAPVGEQTVLMADVLANLGGMVLEKSQEPDPTNPRRSSHGRRNRSSENALTALDNVARYHQMLTVDS
jgi:putative transposase